MNSNLLNQNNRRKPSLILLIYVKISCNKKTNIINLKQKYCKLTKYFANSIYEFCFSKSQFFFVVPFYFFLKYSTQTFQIKAAQCF